MLRKEGKEKYKENKTNYEGAYLGNSLADSAQIWNWRCPTSREFTQKFRVLLFWECWASDAWKRRFLYSCKIHTCLLRALGFVGRTTHYRVSWLYAKIKVKLLSRLLGKLLWETNWKSLCNWVKYWRSAFWWLEIDRVSDNRDMKHNPTSVKIV